jgi:hypothetical protein
MLARVVTGSPLGTAATAELLAALQAMSLAARLERAATVLFATASPIRSRQMVRDFGPRSAPSRWTATSQCA